MKYLIVIFIFFLAKPIFSQTEFYVTGFSKEYYGIIAIEDTSEVFSKGWVAIFDSKSNKELIKVYSYELTFTLHQGKVLANINELLYGEQSQIMYEDYNFDGIKDFAIMNGQNSCYHGPSFEIYLASNNGFILNQDFTRLSQEYCGMFYIDSKAKKISTSTKSGCCWHQYSEFIVENNKPKAIKVIEESMNIYPFGSHVEQIWNGDSLVNETIKKTLFLDTEEIKQILSFKIEKSLKEIVLFYTNDNFLYYALIDNDHYIEFNFPGDSSVNQTFNYDKKQKEISFKTEKTTYKIYNSTNSVGIKIKTEGNIHTLKGILKSRKENLNNLLQVKLENVIIK